MEKNLNTNQRSSVLKIVAQSQQKFKDLESFNNATAKEINNTLQIIKDFYIKMYNVFARLKNKNIAYVRSQENGKKNFINKRDNYQNESLTDLVKNKNEINKIIEFDGQLVQKSDPIYRDAKGFRAHFFAPNKQFFGYSVDTFWMNVFVILGMAFTLFVMLYFDVLKRTLDWIGEISKMIGLSKGE